MVRPFKKTFSHLTSNYELWASYGTARISISWGSQENGLVKRSRLPVSNFNVFLFRYARIRHAWVEDDVTIVHPVLLLFTRASYRWESPAYIRRCLARGAGQRGSACAIPPSKFQASALTVSLPAELAYWSLFFPRIACERQSRKTDEKNGEICSSRITLILRPQQITKIYVSFSEVFISVKIAFKNL